MPFISKTNLFSSWEGSHSIYRIPGLIITTKGTIITYCEAREGKSDWSTKAILQKRSLDEGITWSEEQTIAACEKNEALNNPVMIASHDGTVHFLWQISYRRTFYQKSTDDGIHFSLPIEITSIFDKYRLKDKIAWNLYALGPGHGIELTNGRLIIPIWIAFGKGNAHGPSVVSTIYSNDCGASWHAGEIIPWDEQCPSMNETEAVELSTGKIMLNIRNHSPKFCRTTTISKDGYSNFSKYKLEHTLPDPICFGSIASGNDNGKFFIAFSNCATSPKKENYFARKRKDLTIRISYDDALTWKYARILEKYSGYSDIAISPDGKWIYCFYEHDIEGILKSEPKHLTLSKINIAWIRNNV